MLIHNLVATGSLSYNGVNISYVTGSQTSLDGLNQFSASVNTTTGSLSSSIAILSGSYLTMSGSYSSASGSLSTRVTTIESKYATTGSNIFTGAQTVCANITSTGTIIAQTLNVQQVTSSIVYSSGSNTFGCLTTDRQQFTGSVTMTGSLSVFTAGTSPEFQVLVGGTTHGNALTDTHNITGSLRITGSNALFSVGCVGIGTAAPGTTLMVTKNIPDTNWGTIAAFDSQTSAVNVGGVLTFGGFKCSQTSACSIFGKIIGAKENATTGDECGYLAFIVNDNVGYKERIRVASSGITCFVNTVCAPGMDIMPSGIGVNTLSGIMRVVTTGTSAGIAVGQSNSNRYTHFAANDIQVFNDDYFITTRCAFPLSIGTCYTARLTFAATGEACFSCVVCAPQMRLTGSANFILNPAFVGSSNLRNGGAIQYTRNFTIFTDDGVNGCGFDLQYWNGSSYFPGIRLNNVASGFGNLLLMQNGGNVGIGTTSPCAKLHIQGAANAEDLLYFCTGGSVNTKFVFNINSGADDALILRRNHTTQGNLCIMSWTYNGYVGIGTTTPAAPLHICWGGSANVNPTLIIEGTVADNSNYPRVRFKGGTYPDADSKYPLLYVTNGGLGLYLNGGYSTTFNNPTAVGLNNGTITLETGNAGSLSTRMSIGSTGITCFSCAVCAPIFTTVNGVAAVAAGPSTTDIFTATGPVSSNGMYLILYNQQGAPGGSTGMAFINIWNNTSVDVYNVYCLGLSNVVNSGTTIRIQSLSGNGGFTAVYSAIRLR